MDRKKQIAKRFNITWVGLNKTKSTKLIIKLEDSITEHQENLELSKQSNSAEIIELEKQIHALEAVLEKKYQSIHTQLEQKIQILDILDQVNQKDDLLPERVAIKDAPVAPRLKLGDQLISEGYITQKQLDQVMERQQKLGGRLGDTMIEMGFLSKTQLDKVIGNQPSKGRLGDMLVESGTISQEQLDQAIQFQQKSGGLLGDVLMAFRFIEPEKLYRIIATQSNLGRVGNEFSFDNLKKLPEAMARTYDAIVINQDSNRFLVAVGVPLDQKTKDIIEEYLESSIEQVLATRDELEFFWKSIYEDELMQESTQKLVDTQPENSAHITFTKPQLITLGLMIAVLIVCLLFNWLTTLIVVNLSIQVCYFIMTVFKFAIIMYGTKSNSQLRFTKEEIDAIDEKTLPMYTILVPMYKEGRVIPLLLKNLEALDYPKAKLDVRLLIEEDDIEAQELLKGMRLPAYYTTIIVPHSLPKTKPKACNYGLIRARGEYVVIYDAEDRPDTDQLKKVFLSFQKMPDNCACIQGKLNYFNSDQNILTRWFTQEYSMWFELLLPGIMQLDIPIPLGGTSNHFKMSILRELNAWDPYNVTEDADLGIRLYKSGYITAIVDSRTWEEATSQFGNWTRQRSRWIKGYMQTWLVHMRNPVKLYKELGLKGFFGFQIMVFATPMIPLLNPIFWVMIILWYGWHTGLVSQFFPGFIYYISSWEFLGGNFLFVFSNIAGIYWVINQLEKKQENFFSYSLVKYALLTPIYWVMMSLAAMKAAWQLITKPFYWEKTTHGMSSLHKDDFDQTLDGGGV